MAQCFFAFRFRSKKRPRSGEEDISGFLIMESSWSRQWLFYIFHIVQVLRDHKVSLTHHDHFFKVLKVSASPN
jgi:hypothetical protein